MCYTVKSIDDVRNLVLATRGLSGLADLHGLISKACRRMHRLIGADLAAIAIYDGKDSLIVSAAEGTTTDLVGITLPRGSGFGGRALERSVPATTGNCAAEADHVDDLVEAVVGDDIRGLAAVPLEFGGNWLDVMYAGIKGRRVSPPLMNEFRASLAPLIVSATKAERAGQLAVQEERLRIAQQLHDTAGQIVFKIIMSARELQRVPTAGRAGDSRLRTCPLPLTADPCL